MSDIRLGQVDYLNCLPVYHALEEGILDFRGSLTKGTPSSLNRMLLNGELDVTPMSSIEYARNSDRLVIIPGLSISADGRVDSIMLFSKCPVTELDNGCIAVTTASATSVVLLRVLMDHYFHAVAEFVPCEPDLDKMLSIGDGALLIGDDAMIAHNRLKRQKSRLVATDLGLEWKKFTGLKMVYALWVARTEYVMDNPSEVADLMHLLTVSKDIGLREQKTVLEKARRKTGLPYSVLKDYFGTIRHDLDEDYQRSLLSFYDYAYKSGAINERVRLNFFQGLL